MAVQFDPLAQAHYALDSSPARQVHATLTFDLAMPNAQVNEWYVYGPQVPDLPGQLGMKTRLEPAGEVVREGSPLQRPVLLARLTDRPNEVHSVLTIDGTLYSRRLRILPAGENAPVSRGTLRGTGETFHAVQYD